MEEPLSYPWCTGDTIGAFFEWKMEDGTAVLGDGGRGEYCWAAESGGRHGELEGCGFLYVGSDSIRPGRGGMEQRTRRAQLAPTYKGRVQCGLLLTRTSSLDRRRKGGVEAAKFLSCSIPPASGGASRQEEPPGRKNALSRQGPTTLPEMARIERDSPANLGFQDLS